MGCSNGNFYDFLKKYDKRKTCDKKEAIEKIEKQDCLGSTSVYGLVWDSETKNTVHRVKFKKE